MSRFSEKCKELLTENNTTAYRISKSSDLELTSLQRMITGKRLPKISYVKQFCKALRLPYMAEQDLMELYKIECIGESTYKSYQCILSLLSSMGKISISALESDYSSQDLYKNSISHLTSSHNYYESELLMYSVLSDAFHSASPPPKKFM